MIKDQIKQVIDRVLTWPQERQGDAAQMLLALEAREAEPYHPGDDERAAIEEGFAKAKRGQAVSAEQIAALFKPRVGDRIKAPRSRNGAMPNKKLSGLSILAMPARLCRGRNPRPLLA
jgi:hypothetical protein